MALRISSMEKMMPATEMLMNPEMAHERPLPLQNCIPNDSLPQHHYWELKNFFKVNAADQPAQLAYSKFSKSAGSFLVTNGSILSIQGIHGSTLQMPFSPYQELTKRLICSALDASKLHVERWVRKRKTPIRDSVRDGLNIGIGLEGIGNLSFLLNIDL
ncbi:hypothetical protein B2J93_1206 [Marssonina coronariae]|uniref:Uncharacterized protein n=1 Tax=Diplocarpon coronariae TaxID=2795749 RepID=A0A218ZH17_9HELO|nr:hypothetical protein B2J93_1206 [Marssonina coronariae]